MPKALVSDVISLGFRPEMFGRPDDFASPAAGMVWSILLAVSARVRAAAGVALYDAALVTAPNNDDARRFYLLQDAEKYFAGAELWRRREAFADSELSVARGEGAGQTIGSRYLENAARFEDTANDRLAEASGMRLSAGGSVQVGYVETGPYGATA